MTEMNKELFLNETADFSQYNDVVFQISALAKKDRLVNGDLTVNATIGSLYTEEGKILVFHTHSILSFR